VLLAEMRQGALKVDDADQARVVVAGAAFGPAFPLVVGNVAGAHGGAVCVPLAEATNG
jgi:hypothetical protein